MNKIIETFQSWFRLKVHLHTLQSEKLFKDGEIWWCSVGMNIGEEIFGKGIRFERPILILKKFTKNSFLGLPLTTKNKAGSWYTEVIIQGVRRIGTVSSKEFQSIKQCFVDFYSL